MRKKVLRVVAVAALLTGAAAAGQQPSPAPAVPEALRERLGEIRDRLQLTPEQVAQIKPILEEEAQRLKAVLDKHQGATSRRAKLKMLREMRPIQEDARERITPLLTPEQRTEWKKIREELRAEAKERYKQGR